MEGTICIISCHQHVREISEINLDVKAWLVECKDKKPNQIIDVTFATKSVSSPW